MANHGKYSLLFYCQISQDNEGTFAWYHWTIWWWLWVNCVSTLDIESRTSGHPFRLIVFLVQFGASHLSPVVNSFFRFLDLGSFERNGNCRLRPCWLLFFFSLRSSFAFLASFSFYSLASFLDSLNLWFKSSSNYASALVNSMQFRKSLTSSCVQCGKLCLGWLISGYAIFALKHYSACHKMRFQADSIANFPQLVSDCLVFSIKFWHFCSIFFGHFIKEFKLGW